MDRVLIKKHCYGKSWRRYAPRASPRLLFSFGKWSETAIACNKFLALFNGQNCQKQKGCGTIRPFARTISEKFIY